MTKDRFGYPTAQTPFLHVMLNNSDHAAQAEAGKLSFYNIDFDRILDNLRGKDKEAAKQRLPELRALVADQIAAARALEIEHWRQRDLDYHHAVENGDLVVVEHPEGQADAISAQRNTEALDALNLGRMCRDSVYIVSTARSSDGGIRASGLIYLRRQKYPKSFEILDELARISHDAQLVIRKHLGVFEPPTHPIFPGT